MSNSASESQRTENSDLPAGDKHYKKGMLLIRAHRFKDALAELKTALKETPDETIRQLRDRLEDFQNTGEYEAVLIAGQLLLEANHSDPALLNLLGNAARRLKNYQKANDYYRQALRLDRSFSLAFLNLSASLAKVEKYDSEIRKALAPFDNLKEWVLPDFLNDPEIVENIVQSLKKEQEKHLAKITSLLQEKEKKQTAGDTEGVKELIHKIELEERKSFEPTYERICSRLRDVNRKNWKNKTIDQSRIILQENQFNLGLYALSQKDPLLANKCFFKLKAANCKIENFNLLMSLLLDLENKTFQAIEELIPLLNKNPNNRLLNVNLGWLYRKAGNTLLSNKHLLKTADLTDQSEGLYGLAKILERADEYFLTENYQTALKLYKIVSSERFNPYAWIKTGDCYLQMKELMEAIMAYQEVLNQLPDHVEAKERIKNIQDIYGTKADDLYAGRHFEEAAEYYNKALELGDRADLLLKTIKAYEKLKNSRQVDRLTKNLKQLEALQNKQSQEDERKKLVDNGKLLMNKKDFNGAIQLFEKALDIKPDKEVFVYLIHIFRGLNQKQRLSQLTRRWRILMEREAKLNKETKS